MAVPAALMSTTVSSPFRALIITSVSSHSERLCGMMSPCDRACITSARLLTLFEGGRFTAVSNVSGAVILYCIFVIVFVAESRRSYGDGFPSTKIMK